MRPIPAAIDERPSELSRSFWLVTLLVGIAFFFNEHNPLISRQDHYTQTAEEMVATADGGNMARRVAFLMLATLGTVCFFAARQELQTVSQLFGSGDAAVRSHLALRDGNVSTNGCGQLTDAIVSRSEMAATNRDETCLRFPNPLGILYIAMYLFASASIFWATDSGMCLRRIMVLTLAYIATIGLARRFSLTHLCYMALIVSTTCVGLGVVCEILLGSFRPWESEYRFSGTVHPNTQGMYLATMCCSALCLAHSQTGRKWLFFSIMYIGFALLVLTKSRTSTMGVVFSHGLVWFILTSTRVRLIAPLAAAWGFSVLILCAGFSGLDLEALATKIIYLGRTEEADSFSGRTTIWPVVEEYISQRPWLGYGFECFWTPDHIEAVTEQCQWPIREAHSAYRDMLLSLGILGTILFVATVVAGLLASLVNYVQTRNPCALFWFGVAVNGLFNGMFESGMVMTYFVTFIIAVGFAKLGLFPPISTELVTVPRQALKNLDRPRVVPSLST